MPTVYVDTGVLSLLTHPKGGSESQACARHFASLSEGGWIIAVPEVCDYELRRECRRRHLKGDSGGAKGIERLNELIGRTKYLPITTDVMRRAADLWADLRNRGKQTSHDSELDCDVILGASALLDSGSTVPLVATTNVGHLALFSDAREWKDVR